MNTGKLSHIGPDGRARMVDVSDKAATKRRAVASGQITMNADAFAAARDASGPKGEVIAVAEIAGTMAAKRTADLIPLCHPLPLSKVEVRIAPLADESGYGIEAEVVTTGPTGVEMEALTAVSVAALTLHDMLKAVDKAMEIGAIRLEEKTGGKSGDFTRKGR
ncbi:cyclic pyranopterin monophosphate synthase MoaC [Hyphobacterium marinum]|uniref:Cyclic pyranopterin monophosphate synthase n=1 Tax=Hyphobacterium marinum TaxID=3116574 RepID=A0ABU7LUK2_9PROT|nr:cyclic pyranopterin monophosphate synthase MoaC [Hyphobacterium sp. Y6023]MEE2565171.1 cyclic pyranopterin monophosphate synthase MoaC [Hyphobacterium sp. Y6023]